MRLLTKKHYVIVGCLLAALLISFDTLGDDKVKTFGPNCYYESTKVIRDGEVVEHTQVRKCVEETQQGKQKFDPDNNPKDAMLRDAYKVALYSALAYTLIKME